MGPEDDPVTELDARKRRGISVRNDVLTADGHAVVQDHVIADHRGGVQDNAQTPVEELEAAPGPHRRRNVAGAEQEEQLPADATDEREALEPQKGVDQPHGVQNGGTRTILR